MERGHTYSYCSHLFKFAQAVSHICFVSMANLIAGGMKSLGQHTAVPGANNSVIISEHSRTEHLKMNLVTHNPEVPTDEKPATAEINDAPLLPAEALGQHMAVPGANNSAIIGESQAHVTFKS